MKKVENHVLEGELFATVARNTEHFLCGVARVKRFVYVRLRCIVRNLKRISKMSTLPPLEKFLRTPMTVGVTNITYPCFWSQRSLK